MDLTTEHLYLATCLGAGFRPVHQRLILFAELQIILNELHSSGEAELDLPVPRHVAASNAAVATEMLAYVCSLRAFLPRDAAGRRAFKNAIAALRLLTHLGEEGAECGVSRRDYINFILALASAVAAFRSAVILFESQSMQALKNGSTDDEFARAAKVFLESGGVSAERMHGAVPFLASLEKWDELVREMPRLRRVLPWDEHVDTTKYLRMPEYYASMAGETPPRDGAELWLASRRERRVENN